jgi:hypothetical protein
VRSDDLRREHVLQRQALHRALVVLEEPGQSPAALAAAIEDVLSEVLRDMQREEAELLNSDLLSEDVLAVNTNGG